MFGLPRRARVLYERFQNDVQATITSVTWDRGGCVEATAEGVLDDGGRAMGGLAGCCWAKRPG